MEKMSQKFHPLQSLSADNCSNYQREIKTSLWNFINLWCLGRPSSLRRETWVHYMLLLSLMLVLLRHSPDPCLRSCDILVQSYEQVNRWFSLHQSRRIAKIEDYSVAAKQSDWDNTRLSSFQNLKICLSLQSKLNKES